MRKFASLSLAACVTLATVSAACAEVIGLADSKSAAEFALKTCLPAIDDVGKVEVMARENGWWTPAYNTTSESKSIRSESRWRTNGF
jgi:hypothetical protein